MLMVTTKKEERFKYEWYLDLGCSSHMTRRKDWLININISLKHKVKFANDNSLLVEVICDVLIRRKNGKKLVISNVLYIPDMKSNMLSIGQLIERNYKGLIEDRVMRVIDLSNKLILKAHMCQNRTFKIELDVLEHKCLTTASSRDEWLWHFDRDLVSLSKYLTASAQLYRVVLKDIESTRTNNQTYRYLLVLCKAKAYENLI